ncbi:SDR family oxidoreductase [Bacillus vallismortis]|uniref:SDR family oxidoreductase n=1 Tax=Bacillus vallismortis TaxID=72361 RepID=UPI002DB8E97C|nr:SDR family oxidoreductase [Bacillus vallismortis]MEC1650429.1 SDR family oxidoreductase [Bacillus vallismortis]
MKMTGNTVLITGGSAGIGLELAKRLLELGNEVIICGRSEARLTEAKHKLPTIHTKQCDVADRSQREALYEWAVKKFPNLNVLVNNAGIQKEIDFTKGTEELFVDGDEIELNVQAPVHLSALFTPHLMKRSEAAIVQVTSGLAFNPLAVYPVYCATKAALHSFSLTLRHQLRDTSVEVIEMAPPMVDTGLNQKSRDKQGLTYRGISAEEYVQYFLDGLKEGKQEITNERVEGLRNATRADYDRVFEQMNTQEN